MKIQMPLKNLRTQSSQNLLKLIVMAVFLLPGIILIFLYNMSKKDAYLDYKHNQGINPSHLPANLFPSGFDRSSCYSRYHPLLQQRSKTRKPSSYLISKLRSYESQHKRCAPLTYLYNKSIHALESNMPGMSSECKYVVWLPTDGLGNQMISLASTFLYALLTDRVLLVYPKDGIADLFCEPFPEGSWLLSLDFPLAHKLDGFNKESEECFGKLLGNNLLGKSSTSTPQAYVYIHLYMNFGDLDKRFFCDEDQSYVQDVPWLMMLSDLYFAPSFFSMPCFEQELDNLFPDKETVFHLLANYLFHPSNPVWGLVKRFYKTYLSEFDVRVGIQIRIFDFDNLPVQDILNQILSCTTNNGLLPRAEPGNLTEPTMKDEKNKKIVVLLTSLSRDYFEEIRKLYLENSTTTGDIVAVQQASFEGKQDTGNANHDRRALAEIYLLSLTDELITSALSTFGYAAQGIGGLTPWMIFKSKNESGHDRQCKRVISMEPCYLIPPRYDCKMKGVIDKSVIKYTRPCLDNYWGGVKLVNNHTNLP